MLAARNLNVTRTILSFLCLSILLFINEAKSQSAIPDSVFGEVSLENAIKAYDQSIGPALSLFNGKEYVRNGIRASGFPFFLEDSLSAGIVFYDGGLFSGIPMEYDLVDQHLVIQNFEKSSYIKLIDEKISYFILFGHRFVFLNADNKNNLQEKGFYDQLNEGRLRVFVRRTKRLMFSSQTSENQASYPSSDEYYLALDGEFQKITNEKAIYGLMHEHASDIKKFIKEKKIRFNKDPESSLKRIAEYFNQSGN